MGVVKEVETSKTGKNDVPMEEIVIADCGQYPVDLKEIEFSLSDNDGTEDVFPNYPEDLEDKVDFSRPENESKVLEICDKIKSAGNFFFKSKEYSKAVRKYHKACRYISCLRDAMGSTRDEQEERIRQVEVPLILNMAAVMLAWKKWEEAKAECDKVLEIQEENIKALFRRAQARIEMKDFDEAIVDLNKARDLEPEDKALAKELARAKKAKLDYVQAEKRMYSKMFQ